MDKFLYLISEGLKNVWRHKMTTFTAVFSLFLALYFVGLLATAGENTKSILQYLRSKYKIEVFFKQNIDLKAAKEVSDPSASRNITSPFLMRRPSSVISRTSVPILTAAPEIQEQSMRGLLTLVVLICTSRPGPPPAEARLSTRPRARTKSH